MSPHDLITAYVDAARTVTRWTTRAEQLSCPDEHLHARGKRLLPAGRTCKTCRDRIDALHRTSDAVTRRNAALADQHRYVLKHETSAREKRARIRVKRGTGLA